MQKICLLFACFFALVGCKSEKWGEDIEKFVDDEVYALSKRQAVAELRSKWDEYFRTLGGYAAIRLDGIGSQLKQASAITIMPVATFEDRSKIILAFEIAQFSLIDALGQIESVDKELQKTQTICEDDEALIRLRLDQLGESIARSIVVPDPEWYVSFNCTFGDSSSSGNGTEGSGSADENKGDSGQCWQGLMDSVMSIVGYSEQRIQKDKAREAIGRIPQKVISSSEVLTVSRAICKEERTVRKAGDVIAKASEITMKYRDAHKDLSKALIDLQHLAEKTHAPHLKRQVQMSTGVTTTLEDLIASKTNSELRAVIEQNRRELAFWEAKAFSIQSSCAESVATLRIYRRLILEKSIQVIAVRSTAFAASTDLSNFWQSLEVGASRADAAIDAKKNAGCI